MKHLSACMASLLAACAFATPPPSLSISSGIVHEAHCGQANGGIETYATGGTPPYSYIWSPAPPNGQGTTQISGLSAGDWTLTVTDAMAQQASLTFTIINNPDLLGSDYQYPAQDSHANCPGQCWGEFRVPESYLPGVAPYQYSEPIVGYDVLGEPYFYVPGGACGGDIYQIGITDNTGCSGTMMIVIAEPQIGAPPMAVSNITGSCTGGNGGSITVENVYNGNFFQPPVLALYDMQDNVIAGQENVGQTVIFTGIPPGQYYVRRDWNWSLQYTAFPCDMDATQPFVVPDLGVACGTLSGDVFIDNNDDCAQGGGEVNVPELVLQIEPGGTYAITDEAGHYSIDLGDGSYTLAQNDASLIQLCPVNAPVPFIMASNAQIIDLADSSTVPLDLKAMISSTAAHPGFALSYALKAKNLSPQVSGSVTIQMNFDPQIQYVNASIVPTTITSSTLTWDLPAMSAYAQYNIAVQFLVPPGVTLGTQLVGSVYVTNTLPDAQPANNTAISINTVTGSYDPNEKVVQPADIFFLDLDDHLDYTIRFQNTGTDTAYTVVITDTLSADLDMGSFQNGASSHPCTVDFLGGRVVRWTFASIFLPDSNTNEAASHGFVGFQLKPAEDFVGGNYIDNASDIYFDFNDPIHTNTASVLAEFSVGGLEQAREQERSMVFPNPAGDHLSIISNDGSIERITIIAADGREVLHAVARKSTVILDITGLPAGPYTLIAIQADGARIPERFIKQ
jgi:uncharacterized repeat protein (TIGR01451 family)